MIKQYISRGFIRNKNLFTVVYNILKENRSGAFFLSFQLLVSFLWVFSGFSSASDVRIEQLSQEFDVSLRKDNEATVECHRPDVLKISDTPSNKKKVYRDTFGGEIPGKGQHGGMSTVDGETDRERETFDAEENKISRTVMGSIKEAADNYYEQLLACTCAKLKTTKLINGACSFNDLIDENCQLHRHNKNTVLLFHGTYLGHEDSFVNSGIQPVCEGPQEKKGFFPSLNPLYALCHGVKQPVVEKLRQLRKNFNETSEHRSGARKVLRGKHTWNKYHENFLGGGTETAATMRQPILLVLELNDADRIMVTDDSGAETERLIQEGDTFNFEEPLSRETSTTKLTGFSMAMKLFISINHKDFWSKDCPLKIHKIIRFTS